MNKLLLGALLGGATMLGGCAMNSQAERYADGTPVIIGPQGQVFPSYPVPARDDRMIAGQAYEGAVRLVVIERDAATTGEVNTHYLLPGGRAVAVVEPNVAAVDGQWAMRAPNMLCFTWPVRGVECWDATSLKQGQPIRLTSDRGLTADVTLLKAPMAPRTM